MSDIKLIKIKKNILTDNDNEAKLIRTQLANKKIFMLNLMSSPGSGKTSLIISTLKILLKKYHINVIEGDIDSMVDSEKIVQNGGYAVQINTGGGCHLDASMIKNAIGCIGMFDFNFEMLERRIKLLNPKMKVFHISAKTGEVPVLAICHGRKNIFYYLNPIEKLIMRKILAFIFLLYYFHMKG